jgi:hypothetical protein
MTDNPYINKQNWGRDLLDRLNNFSNEDGSFNVWEELPTVGKDGLPLDESHKGYTGFITSASSQSAMYWDGSRWIVLFVIPFVTTGEEIPVISNQITSTNKFQIIDAGLGESFFYVIYSGSIIQVSRVSKITGLTEWTTNVPFAANQIYCEFFNYNGGAQSVAQTNTQVFVQIREFTTATPAIDSTASVTVFSLNLVSGVMLWKTTLQTIPSRNSYVWLTVNPLGNLYCILYPTTNLYQINSTSGAIINSVSTPDSSINVRRLFYDSLSQRLILFSVRENNTIYVLNPSNLSTIATLSIPDVYGLFYLSLFYFDGFIYYLGSKFSEHYPLIRYSCVNNTISSLFSLSSDIVENFLSNKFILSGFYENNKLTLLTPSDAVINKIEITASQSVTSEMVMQNLGTYAPCVNTSKYSNIYLLKVLLEEKGFGTNYSCQAGYSIATKSGRSIATQNTVSSYNNSAVKGEINCNSLFANLLISSSSRLNKIEIPSSQPPLSQSGIPERKKERGIYFDSFFSLYSLMGTHNALESRGYSGIGAAYTSGLLWGCYPLNGSLVSSVSTLFAGAFIHDPNLNKFFWENKNDLVGIDQVVPSFPKGDGVTLFGNSLGIGNQSPSFKLDVVGTIRGTEIRNSGGVITSDPRLKINMTSLNGGELWEVCQLLNPITFVYKPDFEVETQEISKDEGGNDVINTTKSKWPLPQGIQYGYNALEVEELLPELVDDDPQGIKYLNAGALFPIFQAAATSKIQSLESEVESLKQLVQSLVTRIEVLENA